MQVMLWIYLLLTWLTEKGALPWSIHIESWWLSSTFWWSTWMYVLVKRRSAKRCSYITSNAGVISLLRTSFTTCWVEGELFMVVLIYHINDWLVALLMRVDLVEWLPGQGLTCLAKDWRQVAFKICVGADDLTEVKMVNQCELQLLMDNIYVVVSNVVNWGGETIHLFLAVYARCTLPLNGMNLYAYTTIIGFYFMQSNLK